MLRPRLATLAAVVCAGLLGGCSADSPGAVAVAPPTAIAADTQMAAAPPSADTATPPSPGRRPPTTFTGQIVRVADGDTATMRLADGTSMTIRFSDIDTPEAAHGARRPGQPGSTAAEASLAEMALGKEARALCYPGETYGRRVCHVFVGDVNVNLEQVRRGWAWANRQNPSYMRDPESTTRAEEEARQARRGIWQQASPVSPWEWRQRCWEQRECEGAGT